MHVILAALGAIVTILILLNRLSESGIDVGWLNPFAWKRRRDWAKKYHANPVYALTNPMELTALVMVGLAKGEGEISAEQKREIKRQFREVFHLDDEKAAALFTSSCFLLRGELEPLTNVEKLLAPSAGHFNQEQAQSALGLFRHIASFEGPMNAFQEDVIEQFERAFRSQW